MRPLRVESAGVDGESVVAWTGRARTEGVGTEGVGVAEAAGLADESFGFWIKSEASALTLASSHRPLSPIDGRRPESLSGGCLRVDLSRTRLKISIHSVGWSVSMVVSWISVVVQR